MTDFQKYIQRYLDLIPSADWRFEMEVWGKKTTQLYQNLSGQEGDFAYAPGKWTLKEVLQHLIDAERIFAYRALRFSRKDKTPLPGWDETMYGETYQLNNRSVESLVDEFEPLRKSHVLFFKYLTDGQLAETGMANGNAISVRTLGQLIVGHNIHHLNVIKERYLPILKQTS